LLFLILNSLSISLKLFFVLEATFNIYFISTNMGEYCAMTSTTKEIVWLRCLLADMGVFLSHPTPMYCDNQSSIQIAHNSVFHEQTKHIEIDCLLLVIILSMTQLLCLLFFLPCILQISLPSRNPFLVFIF
jgi:hypothetical protein